MCLFVRICELATLSLFLDVSQEKNLNIYVSSHKGVLPSKKFPGTNLKPALEGSDLLCIFVKSDFFSKGFKVSLLN